MQAVRPQIDRPNWNYRPTPDVQHRKLTDAKQPVRDLILDDMGGSLLLVFKELRLLPATNSDRSTTGPIEDNEQSGERQWLSKHEDAQRSWQTLTFVGLGWHQRRSAPVRYRCDEGTKGSCRSSALAAD